jgi:metal-sulfur cluster biosynthetic enzyme
VQPDTVARPEGGDRSSEALDRLNAIVDPCSTASSTPLGLVDMGVIESVRVHGEGVHVRLMPTFPGCLFVGIFEAEAERRLLDLPWCEQVTVELVGAEEGIWTESRMSTSARERLARRRRMRAGARGARDRNDLQRP